MKVHGMSCVVKAEEFVEVLLHVDLTQTEASEIGCNQGAILNIVYDNNGENIMNGILEGGDFIEISLTDVEVEHINQFIEVNGIYEEVLSLLPQAS